jgi:hypothetical protein
MAIEADYSTAGYYLKEKVLYFCNIQQTPFHHRVHQPSLGVTELWLASSLSFEALAKEEGHRGL